jgi:hypothetical protein
MEVSLDSDVSSSEGPQLLPSTLYPPDIDIFIQEDSTRESALAAVMTQVEMLASYLTTVLEATTMRPERLDPDMIDELEDLHDKWLAFIILNRPYIKIQDNIEVDTRSQRWCNFVPGSHVMWELSRINIYMRIFDCMTSRAEGEELFALHGTIPPDAPLEVAICMMNSKVFPKEWSHWVDRFIPPIKPLTAHEKDILKAAQERVVALTPDQQREVDALQTNKDPYRNVSADEVVSWPDGIDVINFNQRQLIFAISFLARQIIELPKTPLLVQLIEAVYFRHCMLVSYPWEGDVLNHPEYREEKKMLVQPDDADEPEEITVFIPNRDYLVYSYMYLEPLLSRLYFDKLFTSDGTRVDIDARGEELVDLQDRVASWITNDVAKSLGRDTLRKIWQETCDAVYDFPGDYDWFKYLYPNKAANIGSILVQLRKIVSEAYYVRKEISVASVIHNIGIKAASDQYALQLIGAFFVDTDYSDFNWYNRFVVDQDEIHHHFDMFEDVKDLELSRGILTGTDNDPVNHNGTPPIIVEIFASCGVWYKHRYWEAPSKFMALVAWIIMCERDEHYVVDGIQIKHAILDPIFRPVVAQTALTHDLYERSIL